MIRLENLSVGYKVGGHERILISRLNMSISTGEVPALLGANCRGQSTLLRTISALQSPLDGRVLIDGKDVAACSTAELARLLTIVTGHSDGAGAFTVEELVRLGRQPYTGFFGRLSDRDRAIVAEAMAMVGVSHLASRHVATLSDGERQKAMIAKAIAQQTPVIILDEPTAFLDVANRLELLMLLRDISHSQHKAVLMSIHDVSSVMPIADQLWLVVPTATSHAPSTPGSHIPVGSHPGATATPESEILSGSPAELIASDAMQHLFPDRPISFDPLRGDFLPSHP